MQSTEAFLDEAGGVAEQLQIKLPPLDRRTMRDALLAHRQQLRAALEAESDAATALKYAVFLLAHRHLQRALHLPTRLISRAVEALQKAMPPADFVVLSTFSSSVVELLRLRAERARSAVAAAPDGDDARLVTLLNESLPRLRALALAASEQQN